MSTDCDGRSRIVGTKQILKLMEQEQIEEVVIAKNAESHVTSRVIELAKTKGVAVHYCESMEELGKSCGISVGAAAAGYLRKN